MGKSKKRIFHKGINDLFDNITREEALNRVLFAFKQKNVDEKIKDLILLFGFSCEELLEQGAKYEDVVSIEPILNP